MMSKYQPNKKHLREALLLLYKMKKTPAESHNILCETYGKLAPSPKICQEVFQEFTSGTFNNPNKLHMREALIFLFHMKQKKRAITAHRLLIDAYGSNAPSEKTCQEWFRRFKKGAFNTEDKERTGRPRTFADRELQMLLDSDPAATRSKLSEVLNISKSSISKRLKDIGAVYKDGKWVQSTSTEEDE